jgi:hypothetical protein
VVTNGEDGANANEEAMTVALGCNLGACVDFLLVALLFVTDFTRVSTKLTK